LYVCGDFVEENVYLSPVDKCDCDDTYSRT
jgi:hypothetical protein